MMAMVRSFFIRAAIFGHGVRCLHALSFVGTRQAATSAIERQHQLRRVLAFSSDQKYAPTNLRIHSKLMESPTDRLDGNEVVDQSADVLIYDDDIIDDDDDVDEPREMENSPSRAQVLHNALLKAVQSALNNLNKKTTSLQRELEKAQSLEETMARANLIVANLYRITPGTTSIEVEDWENDGKIVELVLNTKEYASAQEESDALFALARKMKRGSLVVQDLLNNSLEGEDILKGALSSLENISFDGTCEEMQLEGTLALIQEQLERSSSKTGFKPPNLNNLHSNNAETKGQKAQSSQKSQRDSTRYKPNPRELISPNGHKVLVGRNRRDNEAICFQLSRPTDIWMHSRGCPGAHVLLCVRRGSPEVTDDDLQFAADLAVFYSDARTERKAPVSTAEPKHITKPRGAPPGAVSLRQEGKTLFGRPEMVSDDLKEAREMSGGAWDEMGYRSGGTRSKNKKRTAAVEKSTRERKRQEANAKNKRRAKKDENDWY